MSMVRDAISSTRGRVVIGVVVAIVAWQAWLSFAAAGKIGDGIEDDEES